MVLQSVTCDPIRPAGHFHVLPLTLQPGFGDKANGNAKWHIPDRCGKSKVWKHTQGVAQVAPGVRGVAEFALGNDANHPQVQRRFTEFTKASWIRSHAPERALR